MEPGETDQADLERRGWARSRGAVALAAAVLSLTVLLGGLPALAQNAALDDAFQQTAQEVLAERRYQTELPGPPEPEALPPPRDPLEIPEGAATVGRVLFWGLLLAGGALLAYRLILEGGRLIRRGPALKATEENGPARPAARGRQREGGALEEADRLARQGRFGDAMHTLLLAGLDDLRRRQAAALAPSLTSREILAIAGLSAEVKAALAPMVNLVELEHFGGRPSGAPEYQTCRENFQRLATPGTATAPESGVA